VAIKAVRTERGCAVAPYEQVDVTNVIRLENDDCRRRSRVEPPPHLSRVWRRSERIQD
jgi:hypothetical protein